MSSSVQVRNVNGVAAVVDLKTADDVTVDVFSDAALTEQVSLPATITTDTTFYTAGTGGYLLSVKVGGVEVAGPVELFLHGEGPVSFALDPDMSNTEIDTLLSASSGGSETSFLGVYNFAFDTPDLLTGVDTGIVVPAGANFTYDDQIRFVTTFAGDGVTNAYLIIGTGPDLGTEEAPGADQLTAVDIAGATPDSPFLNSNPTILTAGSTGLLGSAGTAYAAAEFHLWAKLEPAGGDLASGEASYALPLVAPPA